MIKIVVNGTAVVGLCVSAPALADKLDRKWTDAREVANVLGDMAQAGDTSALQSLVNLAAKDDAPAMHNIGWLYTKGYPGVPADRKTACDWYSKAAKLSYPPSMHERALCLFSQYRNGPKSRYEIVNEAVATMSNAAKAGWIGSAIHLSEYQLNHRLMSHVQASEVYEVTGWGLESKPDTDQKRTLSYLRGMAVMFGGTDKSTTSQSVFFREAEQALTFADSNGHPAAGKEIPKIRTHWLRAVVAESGSWTPPSRTAQYCLTKVKNPQETRYEPAACFATFGLSKSKLVHLDEDYDYLESHLTGNQKEILAIAKVKLHEKSAAFRAENYNWESLFKPLYVKRVNAGDWSN